jgi:RND family efflux transporter MFP subunit
MSTPSCFCICAASGSRWGLAVLTVALVLAGCQKGAEKPAPVPPLVTVSRAIEREVIQWDQYSAYLSSPQMANVQARVSGLIEAAPFKEGSIVHQGDLLFKIDPRPFQADLDSKKAAIVQAQSIEDQAKVHLARYSRVVGTQAISQDDYDAAKASYEQAVASVSAAEAALETSRLNLEWTDVRAPIAGRVSRMNVTVGNLVNGGSGQTTLLTTIVSIDPMYCYIDVPETAALRYQKLALQEKQADVAGAKIPCFLELEDETAFVHPGVIDFVDNQVNVGTGTVQIRGVFANPTGLLTPGLFTLMRIPASGRYQATLIPDAAVNTDQNERYLLIVGADNIAQRRAIKLGALFGTLRSIPEGLKPGEQVIVNGMQSAAPGAKVNPHETPVSTEALDDLLKTAEGSPTTQALPASQPSAETHP